MYFREISCLNMTSPWITLEIYDSLSEIYHQKEFDVINYVIFFWMKPPLGNFEQK